MYQSNRPLKILAGASLFLWARSSLEPTGFLLWVCTSAELCAYACGVCGAWEWGESGVVSCYSPIRIHRTRGHASCRQCDGKQVHTLRMDIAFYIGSAVGILLYLLQSSASIHALLVDQNMLTTAHVCLHFALVAIGLCHRVWGC